MATEEQIKKMVDTLKGKFPGLEEDAYLAGAERIYEIGAQGGALEITCKGGEIVVTKAEEEEPEEQLPRLSRQSAAVFSASLAMAGPEAVAAFDRLRPDDSRPYKPEAAEHFRQRRTVRKYFQNLRQREGYSKEDAYYACCDRFGAGAAMEHLEQSR